METEVKKRIVEFSEIQRQGFFPCPRCGHYRMYADPIRNALSRQADIQVCDNCGADEALRDFAGIVLPITEWAIAKNASQFIRK